MGGTDHIGEYITTNAAIIIKDGAKNIDKSLGTSLAEKINREAIINIGKFLDQQGINFIKDVEKHGGLLNYLDHMGEEVINDIITGKFFCRKKGQKSKTHLVLK